MASDDDKTPVSVIPPEPKPRMDGPGTFDEHDRHRHSNQHHETNRVLRDLTEVLRDLRDEFYLNRQQNLRTEEMLARVELLLINLLQYFEPQKGNGHG